MPLPASERIEYPEEYQYREAGAELPPDRLAAHSPANGSDERVGGKARLGPNDTRPDFRSTAVNTSFADSSACDPQQKQLHHRCLQLFTYVNKFLCKTNSLPSFCIYFPCRVMLQMNETIAQEREDLVRQLQDLR